MRYVRAGSIRPIAVALPMRILGYVSGETAADANGPAKSLSSLTKTIAKRVRSHTRQTKTQHYSCRAGARRSVRHGRSNGCETLIGISFLKDRCGLIRRDSGAGRCGDSYEDSSSTYFL